METHAKIHLIFASRKTKTSKRPRFAFSNLSSVFSEPDSSDNDELFSRNKNVLQFFSFCWFFVLIHCFISYSIFIIVNSHLPGTSFFTSRLSKSLSVLGLESPPPPSNSSSITQFLLALRLSLSFARHEKYHWAKISLFYPYWFHKIFENEKLLQEKKITLEIHNYLNQLHLLQGIKSQNFVCDNRLI